MYNRCIMYNEQILIFLPGFKEKMASGDRLSTETLTKLVFAMPLLTPDGREIRFAGLSAPNQWVVAASKIVLESLLAVKDRSYFSSFADNALAAELARKGYGYGQSFAEAEEGRQVIHFRDWHHFILDSVSGLPKPSMQVVQVGEVVEDDREVKILSAQWNLVGLEADPDRSWGNWAMRAVTHSLANEKLALQAQPFGLGQVGCFAAVDCNYYGMFTHNI